MSEIIGKQLQAARLGLEVSLEQAAEETHIRLHYLQALEEGDFGRLPSKAHERGFLRSYADYLGLNSDALLRNIDQQEFPTQEVEAAVPADTKPEEDRAARKSDSIFVDLGEQLQNRREMLGFSLEEVERNIHVRQHYLEALESGDLEGLPSPVQGRGMLQNYAKFLGMDVEAVLLKYADVLQAQLVERKARAPVQADTKPRSGRAGISLSGFFPGDWILRTILIVAVIAFVIWGIIRINSLQAAAPLPEETVPAIVDALQTTPVGDNTVDPQLTETPILEATELANSPGNPPPLPPPAESTQETPVPTISDAPIQVYVSVLRRAWIRVTVDGEVEFEGRVIPGSAYSFSGQFEVELLTGNGAGLQVFLNGTDLGVLGVYGEVVNRVFTPEGVLLPTATSTPLPTNTPAASPTPQATPAP